MGQFFSILRPSTSKIIAEFFIRTLHNINANHMPAAASLMARSGEMRYDRKNTLSALSQRYANTPDHPCRQSAPYGDIVNYVLYI